MLQRRRSRCRPTAAALARSLLNPPATPSFHPPPANLLSHSSVSTPPPLNPPSKQPSIITKAPARYIRIAPIHPPSKGLISALPLELVLLPPPLRKRRPDWQGNPAFRWSRIYQFAWNSRIFVLFFFVRPSFSGLEIIVRNDVSTSPVTGTIIDNCRINYEACILAQNILQTCD